MKVVGLILLGCIGYTMASFSPFNAASSIFQQVARMKRDVSNDSPSCLISCGESIVFAFEAKIKSSKIPFDADTLSFNQAVCESHNPKLFEIACHLYEKFIQCVNECPARQTENFPYVLFKSADFMCNERFDAFEKHLPCVFGTCNKARPICESKCQQYQKKLEGSLKGLPTLNQDSPEEIKGRIENLISIVCGYIDCTMNCLYPQFKNKCGYQAENLERELMQQSIESVKDYVASFQTDFEWPQSCHTLADNTFLTNEYERYDK